MTTSSPTTLKTSTRRGTRSTAPRAISSARAAVQALDISPQERQRMIEEAAYYRAQQRGFAPGNEMEDWVAAETEVDARLGRPTPC
jgi:DUF2934 family protein